MLNVRTSRLSKNTWYILVIIVRRSNKYIRRAEIYSVEYQ